ncbi:hypothetical protein SD70_02315 [Gordoniibacillus kamchatkensis]|uniref:Uncharacterized protein n=1 Tax=Gordoniibacillus kamchatkensis TaxID=1590651 RepID=A0ABR5ALY6_9BACL|nr:hypothetical protein [Paenibacillus sp. VKM B-2647]KIL42043.1 hypothetical protein SD70_02315 [Paenibacillus sp. VKM B-2647]
MSPREIEVGKTYHNGNQGMLGTARKVLEMGVHVKHLDGKGTESDTGVRFRQEKGPYSGRIFVIPLVSFAKWAKGEVEEGAAIDG